MASDIPSTTGSPVGGVQSLHRALDLLEVLELGGGHLAIGEIAAATGLPLPTIHRLLRTLVERGYVRQLANRRYALGFRFVPLGIAANTLVGGDARAVLADVVAEVGESANFAVLVGDSAEYVTQVPSPHAMRMFTEVGRRVRLHCTGVGKALLAQMPPSAVSAIVRRSGLPAQTPHTITTENALLAELERVRDRGYALDEEEQELGVRCVSMALEGEFLAPMAISVSGPVTRMTDAAIDRCVPLLRNAARRIEEAATSTSTTAASATRN